MAFHSDRADTDERELADLTRRVKAVENVRHGCSAV